MAQPADPVSKIKTSLGLQEPPLFKVIYINDDKTPMEFVIYSLEEYFSYDSLDAFQITQDVHEKGSAVVAVLPYEIAEQKGVEVTMDARKLSYPLQIKIEPEKK
jgi:ATP-dependent Clp protease adaptor protein ClpS